MAARADRAAPTGKRPRAIPGIDRPTGEAGFEVVIRMLPDLAPWQERQFEQDLARYLDERHLQADGTPLAMAIRSDGRRLTVTDQVDLVAWLMLSAPVAAVRATDLAGPSAEAAAGDGEQVPGSAFKASRCDLAVQPLLQLYRLGRIQAEWVARILAQ